MSGSGVRPRQLVVWVLAVVLLGVILVLDRTDISGSAPSRPAGRVAMFGFEEADLGAVQIVYEGRQRAVMRDAAGRWFEHGTDHRHVGAEADDGILSAGGHVADPERSEKIAEQLAVTARMLADRRVRPDRGLDDYGLASPRIMIAFYARSRDGADYTRPLSVLYVGDLLTTEYAYYTMREGDQELSLVPRYFIALLLGLLYGEEQAPTPLPVRDSARDGDSAGE